MEPALSQQRERPARRAERRKLFQPAELRDVAGTQRVHLLDLSMAGGQAHAARPPSEGTIVTLCCERFSCLARVAWVDGKRVGLSFIQPLGATDLAAMLGDEVAIIR